jgi:hypothetical protein
LIIYINFCNNATSVLTVIDGPNTLSSFNRNNKGKKPFSHFSIPDDIFTCRQVQIKWHNSTCHLQTPRLIIFMLATPINTIHGEVINERPQKKIYS